MARRLTSAQIVARDARIVELRAGGMKWSDIAAAEGVDRSHAQRVFAEHLKGRVESLSTADPVMLLAEMLAEAEAIGDNMAKVALNEAETPHARATASRTQLAALRTRLVLLQSVGALPSAPERTRYEQMFVDAMRTVLGILNQRGIGLDVQREIIEAVEPPREIVERT